MYILTNIILVSVIIGLLYFMLTCYKNPRESLLIALWVFILLYFFESFYRYKIVRRGGGLVGTFDKIINVSLIKDRVQKIKEEKLND